jgi:hypothetical protein
MLSGRRLDLLDPSPLDIEIADIAHGLARVARWNGQTEGAHIFSGAQHTLLVDIVARARWPSLDELVGAAYLEATRLAGFSAAEARRFFGPPPVLSPAIERDYLTPWPAGTAEKRFLERFNALSRG